MKVLLVGEAAREHIIAEQLAKDAELYAVMRKKNPGIAKLAKKIWLCDNTNAEEVSNCIKDEKFDLGFVSPDALLAAGITDVLAKQGIPVASPSKAAARIEWDKGFMRNLMKKHNISGQVKHVITSSEEEARKTINELGDVAIKPLGLTGGKGVRVSGDHFANKEEALAYAQGLIAKDGNVLVEEKLNGEEFTLQAFCDGSKVVTMPPVQDHKRAFVDDKGPNTGGMGSYSTGRLLPFLDASDLDQAIQIMQNTITAMKKEGAPFTGILYGQFMIMRDGVRVVEFNARFGDPEAMNVLSLLKDSLSSVFSSMAQEKLSQVSFTRECTVVKYLVPEGYPGSPVADSPITLDEQILAKTNAKAYFASVYEKDSTIYTTKSRAIALVGTGASLEEAEQKAEAACKSAKGPLRYRSDIGTAPLIQKKIEHMKKIKGK